VLGNRIWQSGLRSSWFDEWLIRDKQRFPALQFWKCPQACQLKFKPRPISLNTGRHFVTFLPSTRNFAIMPQTKTRDAIFDHMD
jgi:hypothetical protein